MIQVNYEIKNLDFKQDSNSLKLDYLFPKIQQEKIKEYNDFINGFTEISNQLASKQINSKNKNILINTLSAYASSTLFTSAHKKEKHFSTFFDLNSNSKNNKENIEIIINRLNTALLRNMKNSFNDPNYKFNSFFTDLNSFCKNKLNKLDDSNFNIKIKYANKEFIYPSTNALKQTVNKDRFSKYKNEEFIGDQNLVKSMYNLSSLLLYYDLDKKKNPVLDVLNMPKVITLMGPSGTGKTMLTLKTINYLSNKCAELNKPFEFSRLDTSKSEYRNLSEKNLNNLFEKAYAGNSIQIILAEEIDTKIHSRKNLSKQDASEASFTGTFLNCLDGLDKYKGNFLVIATTNRQINPDSALRRRLMQYPLFFEGLKTNKEHIQLFKNKFSKALKCGYLKVNDWYKIGETSKKYGFQGGDIHNITTKLTKQIITKINFNKETDFQNIQNIRKNIRPINTDLILETMLHYNKEKKLYEKDFLEE